MSVFDDWAEKYDIPPKAVDEFVKILAEELYIQPKIKEDSRTEATIQDLVRMKAATEGARLWRNNVGAFRDPRTDRVVRYGLCNESSRMNRKIKSSDLVGIKPVIITESMVGTVFGQFLAREIKRPGWEFKGTEREKAQLAFLAAVKRMGGDAKFTTSDERL